MKRLTAIQSFTLYLHEVKEIWKKNKKARFKIALMALLPVVVASGWIIIIYMLFFGVGSSKRQHAKDSLVVTGDNAMQAMGLHDAKVEKKGYVIWHSPPNVFSQLAGLRAAVLIAQAVNRTLVVPPMILGLSGKQCLKNDNIGNGSTTDWEEMIDVSDILNKSQMSFVGKDSLDLEERQRLFGEGAVAKLKKENLVEDISATSQFYISSNGEVFGTAPPKNSLDVVPHVSSVPGKKHIYLGCLSEDTNVVFTYRPKAPQCLQRDAFGVSNNAALTVAGRVAKALGGKNRFWAIQMDERLLSSEEDFTKTLSASLSTLEKNTNQTRTVFHARTLLSHDDRLKWCRGESVSSVPDVRNASPVTFVSVGYSKTLPLTPGNATNAFPCVFTLSELDPKLLLPLYKVEKPRFRGSKHAGLKAEYAAGTGDLLFPLVELAVSTLTREFAVASSPEKIVVADSVRKCWT
ncbi:hypothetical protein HDU97_003478 [Phlyctochytrium planicorne]|nr:hypothetical protein HDU97_003478 [Phlyctochytrium planicorne]